MVDCNKLVWKSIHLRDADGKMRVELVRQTNSLGFQRDTEVLGVGLEIPAFRGNKAHSFFELGFWDDYLEKLLGNNSYYLNFNS